MFIQTESTPNPATLKFLPGQTVLEAGTADFPSSETAGKSPLASRIFAVDGVTGVFFGTDFVTVTKADAVQWDHIKPALLGAIMEHFQSGQPVMDAGDAPQSGHAEHTGEDGEIVGQIEPAAPLHPRGNRGPARCGLTPSSLPSTHRPRIARPLCCRATG